jgi:hypothetical protein
MQTKQFPPHIILHPHRNKKPRRRLATLFLAAAILAPWTAPAQNSTQPTENTARADAAPATEQEITEAKATGLHHNTRAYQDIVVNVVDPKKPWKPAEISIKLTFQQQLGGPGKTNPTHPYALLTGPLIGTCTIRYPEIKASVGSASISNVEITKHETNDPTHPEITSVKGTIIWKVTCPPGGYRIDTWNHKENYTEPGKLPAVLEGNIIYKDISGGAIALPSPAMLLLSHSRLKPHTPAATKPSNGCRLASKTLQNTFGRADPPRQTTS